MPASRLVVVVGQEGVGKSTVVRALLPYVSNGAVLDAEDVGQVNPWTYDEAFRELHRRDVAAVASNFWAAGYRTVVAGSFLGSLAEYVPFRALLPAEVEVTVVHLLARTEVRDLRRAGRAKQTTREWRDAVDEADPVDPDLGRAGHGYRYLALDTSDLTLAATVQRIRTDVRDVEDA